MKQANRDHLDRHVVVRLARLLAAPDVQGLASDLSSADRERAGRFRFEEDRARFVLGRRLLGMCLRRYLGHAAGAVKLELTSQGRPFLPGAPEVQFSISHSEEWVAVALAIGTRVGIDLEYLPPGFDPNELAAQVFSEEDFVKFQAVPQAEAVNAFFQAWTAKEACLKARGIGIVAGMKEVSVPLNSQAGTVQEKNGATWRLQGLPLPVGYVGKVAWDDPRKALDIQTISPGEHL